jgi:hypothetical protein
MANVRWREVHKDGQILIEEIHKVVVHRFTMGDVEDPELYCAEPIYKWQQTEAGKFVMKHAIDTPVFRHQIDHNTFGYKFAIIAELEAKKLSEYLLKFGK